MLDFCVAINADEAVKIIKNKVVNGSITGTLTDEYENAGVTVLVFDKHYYRAGNRLTLTVIIDTVNGRTHIHAVGGGGGQGLLRFDWGASGSFENCIRDALCQYIIQ